MGRKNFSVGEQFRASWPKIVETNNVRIQKEFYLLLLNIAKIRSVL